MIRRRNPTPSLAENQRIVAALIHKFGTDYLSMADALGISHGTAKNLAVGTAGRPTFAKAAAYLCREN